MAYNISDDLKKLQNPFSGGDANEAVINYLKNIPLGNLIQFAWDNFSACENYRLDNYNDLN